MGVSMPMPCPCPCPFFVCACDVGLSLCLCHCLHLHVYVDEYVCAFFMCCIKSLPLRPTRLREMRPVTVTHSVGASHRCSFLCPPKRSFSLPASCLCLSSPVSLPVPLPLSFSLISSSLIYDLIRVLRPMFGFCLSCLRGLTPLLLWSPGVQGLGFSLGGLTPFLLWSPGV